MRRVVGRRERKLVESRSEEPEEILPEGRAFTEKTRNRGELAGSQATFARGESLRQQPVSPI